MKSRSCCIRSLPRVRSPSVSHDAEFCTWFVWILYSQTSWPSPMHGIKIFFCETNNVINVWCIWFRSDARILEFNFDCKTNGMELSCWYKVNNSFKIALMSFRSVLWILQGNAHWAIMTSSAKFTKRNHGRIFIFFSVCASKQMREFEMEKPDQFITE